MRLAHGTDAFALFLDNLLGFDLQTTRRIMALYSLLYNRIMISDSWLVCNAPLGKMLTTGDGVEFLRGNILVPVRRDSVTSFAEFVVQSRAKQMHGLCVTDDLVSLLDGNAQNVVTFSMKQVSASYVTMVERVLEQEVLMRFGVTEASSATVARLLKDAKVSGVDWKTNTWVKDLVCPNLPANDAMLVMEVARAPYALNLPVNILSSGIAGPDGFRGDQILTALRGQQCTLATMGIAPVSGVHEAMFRARMNDALVNWLLSSEVLQELTATDLGYARNLFERTSYLLALTKFLRYPNQLNWDDLVMSLEQYLNKAAREVFRLWRQTDRLRTDPVDGQVVVEGATTIRILRPDKPVELSGSSEPVDPDTTMEVEPVQIIGKTIKIPVAEVEEASA